MDGRQPAIEVRRAATTEARAVADVWLRSRRASVPAIPAPVHTDDEVRDWFADVVLPSREVWVAVPRSAAAARSATGATFTAGVTFAPAGPMVVAILVIDGDWLDQLYVDPDWCGSGIGMALVEVAKRSRPDGLDLWTFAANAGARRFYERNGFVAVDATHGDNEEGEPDVRYHWPEPAVDDAG